MPTYVYKREDGSTFEIEQRISEDALTTCPTTGQKVSRVISGGTGLIFKGSGFYLTDYARSNGNGSHKPEPEKKETSGSSTESSDSSTSTAPAKSDTTSKDD